MIKPTGSDYLRALFKTDSMADAGEGFSDGLLGVCEVIGGLFHFAALTIFFVGVVGGVGWLVVTAVRHGWL